MANTVTLLSYANTFGDWVVTTNKLAQENNDLAANNFVKPTGTLFLNSPSLGLQVANNATIQGQLQVSGIGSSVYIQRNLQVDGSIISTGNNYITASDSNPAISITQNGIGLALRVANGNVSFSNTLLVQKIVSQNTVSEVLSANVRITAPTIVAPTVNVATLINSPTADLIIDDVVANTATIQGNFVINGDIVYSSDNLTINSGTVAPANAVFAVDRGTGNANAEIRWNESVDYFEIRDINNPTSYSKILTANLISDNLTSTSSSTFASSAAANALNSLVRSSFSSANAGVTLATSAYAQANNASGNTVALQAVSTTQNTNITSINTLANSAYREANTQNTINQTQNTWIIAVNTLANSAYREANTQNTINQTQNTWITNTDTLARAAYAQANNASGNTVALQSVNSTQNTNITSINTFAQAAFAKANIGAPSTTITDDISTDNTIFLLLSTQSSGNLTIANTSSSKLTYNPSTGTLSSVIFSATSDINKKENVERITDAVSTVQQLRGVTYNWKDNGSKGMGLIAQEVEKILPELVTESDNGKAISYNNIIGLLVEAIKELKIEIDNLKGDSK
jgi:hypothetical protein